MRIDPQPWMTAPGPAAVHAAIAAAGGEARFVGGCVRDAVLGRPVADIDMATTLRPEALVVALKAAGIRAVPTGLAHGTVTAVAGGQPIEVTTLRVDVETDGRHARVAFTDDWRADAARRDFTLNALSAEPDGTLHDFFGGIADAQAGQIRFVGRAEDRVAEDVLRVLRFFRFFAHYGRSPADPAALAACRRAAPLVAGLSGERVQAELLKLLAAADPVPAWRLMAAAGVAAAAIGRPGDVGRLAGLIAVEGPAVDPLCRLAALLASADGAGLADRLRLANQERDRLAALLAPVGLPGPEADDDALRRALASAGRDLLADRVLLCWAGHPDDARWGEVLRRVRVLPVPDFPLRGRDALALGFAPGEAVGRALAAVRSWWLAGGCRADRAACLARLAAILAQAVPPPPPPGPPGR